VEDAGNRTRTTRWENGNPYPSARRSVIPRVRQVVDKDVKWLVPEQRPPRMVMRTVSPVEDAGSRTRTTRLEGGNPQPPARPSVSLGTGKFWLRTVGALRELHPPWIRRPTVGRIAK